MCMGAAKKRHWPLKADHVGLVGVWLRKSIWHIRCSNRKTLTTKSKPDRTFGFWPRKSTWQIGRSKGKTVTTKPGRICGGLTQKIDLADWAQQRKTPPTKSRPDRTCGGLTQEIYLADWAQPRKTLITTSRWDRTCGGFDPGHLPSKLGAAKEKNSGFWGFDSGNLRGRLGAAKEKHWPLKADEIGLVGVWPRKSTWDIGCSKEDKTVGAWPRKFTQIGCSKGKTLTIENRWDRTCEGLTQETYLADWMQKREGLWPL